MTHGVRLDPAPDGEARLSVRPADAFLGIAGPSHEALHRDPVARPAQPPWASVCLLNMFDRDGTFLGSATGFLIKSDVVVTARHALGPATRRVAVLPGYDARNHVSADIVGIGYANDDRRDLGVIVTRPTSLAGVALANAAAGNMSLVGYSEPYPDLTPMMSFASAPAVVAGAALEYAVKAAEGDSGGPVFNASMSAVIGVHVRAELRNGSLKGIAEPVDAELNRIVARLEGLARNPS